MLAIHNDGRMFSESKAAANAFAKLSKCQQFTTTHHPLLFNLMLQTLLQSYQNVSNSQPNRVYANRMGSCKRFCKVIKMLAIHNRYLVDNISKYAANAFAKLSKCQQFTTKMSCTFRQEMLQTLLQSYQNVSNSQPLPSA